MADNKQLVIGKEELQELLSGILAKANEKMNPADRLVFDEQMSRMQRMEQFKSIMAADVAAAEARKLGCTHKRWPKGHDLAGHPCPANQGEWVTGGQIFGRGNYKHAGLVCLRGCGATWKFIPTDDEQAFIEDRGMLGWPPPPEDRVVERCMWCDHLFPKRTVHTHEATCGKKPAPSPMKAALHPSLASVLEVR